MIRITDLQYYQDQGQSHCCHADSNEVAELSCMDTQDSMVYISVTREEKCERIWISRHPLFQPIIQLISGPETVFSQTLALCRHYAEEEYCLIDGQPVEAEDDPSGSSFFKQIEDCRKALVQCHGHTGDLVVKEVLQALQNA